MQREVFHPVVIVSCIALVCLAMGLAAESAKAEETEILKITVGEPTTFSEMEKLNCASLAVSRTGVVAAFYPKPYPFNSPKFYRTSTDGGQTWGEGDGFTSLVGRRGLQCGDARRWCGEGVDQRRFFEGEAQYRSAPMQGEYEDGSFKLHSTFAWFNDDFTKFEVAPVHVYMPDAVTTKQIHLSGVTSWPNFDKGKMIQLDDGDLLSPMYGLFKGDTKSRVVISRSSDRGHSWHYYATVAVNPNDPNPELLGQYIGFCGSSIEILSNGQMICVMRVQRSDQPNEYKPMYVCWSDDLGKTWTKPVVTNPHLMNIWPTVQTLANGVVAVIYGRPGFHMARWHQFFASAR